MEEDPKSWNWKLKPSQAKSTHHTLYKHPSQLSLIINHNHNHPHQAGCKILVLDPESSGEDVDVVVAECSFLPLSLSPSLFLHPCLDPWSGNWFFHLVPFPGWNKRPFFSKEKKRRGTHIFIYQETLHAFHWIYASPSCLEPPIHTWTCETGPNLRENLRSKKFITEQIQTISFLLHCTLLLLAASTDHFQHLIIIII